MTMPNFAADASVYRSARQYRSAGSYGLLRGARPGAVVPAIPFCGNCDEILERCARNGGRPRAVCRACAIGNCFSGVEDPFPNDPFRP
jgi:hypothetical protein